MFGIFLVVIFFTYCTYIVCLYIGSMKQWRNMKKSYHGRQKGYIQSNMIPSWKALKQCTVALVNTTSTGKDLYLVPWDNYIGEN